MGGHMDQAKKTRLIPYERNTLVSFQCKYNYTYRQKSSVPTSGHICQNFRSVMRLALKGLTSFCLISLKLQ